MGNRANYVVKRDGRLRIFYSHCAAESIGVDVFWGPEATEVIMSANQETGRWLDDVWGEAAIALDHDRKAAAYFGRGELFLDESYAEDDGKTLRQVFSVLLETLWGEAGWTIRVVRALPDIVEFVGLDRRVAEAKRKKLPSIPLEQLSCKLEGLYLGVLSLRQGPAWIDLITDQRLPNVLMNGPSLLAYTGNLRGLDDFLRDPPREGRDQIGKHYHFRDEVPFTSRMMDHALLDPESKVLVLRISELDERDIPFFAEAWTGWRIELRQGRCREHFAQTGRKAPVAMVPVWKFRPRVPARSVDECLQLIRKQVLQVTASPWEAAPPNFPLGGLAEKRFDELVQKTKPQLAAISEAIANTEL